MAISVFKTFSAGEVLTAADLNSSFTQITSNGEDLGWPATKDKDLDGFDLILDSDGDTKIDVIADDRVSMNTGGTRRLEFNNNGVGFGDYQPVSGSGLAQFQVDTTDDVDHKEIGLRSGGFGSQTDVKTYTTTSLTTAKTVAQPGSNTRGAVIFVYGDDGASDYFMDIVQWVDGAVTETSKVGSTPANRTYSVTASNLLLANSSGTWSVRTLTFVFG